VSLAGILENVEARTPAQGQERLRIRHLPVEVHGQHDTRARRDGGRNRIEVKAVVG
jgi:hypothetical protein